MNDEIKKKRDLQSTAPADIPKSVISPGMFDSDHDTNTEAIKDPFNTEAEESQPPAESTGAYKPIGREQVAEAMSVLQRYKSGKSALEQRIKENEEWWRLRNWEHINAKQSKSDLKPTSAWLFNSIANKHADIMDNFPKPNILPRAVDDEEEARKLSAIIPVILEQNCYEETYDNNGWRKLIGGSCCTGVFWNSDKLNGLGDVDVRKISLLSLFWEPGIDNIQDSANVFSVEKVDVGMLKREYPNLNIGTNVLGLTEYKHDDTDTEEASKTDVVDWYYKKKVGTKTVLHYCKFCCGEILYASENEPEYAEDGYYWHGLYPFDIDYCFPVEGSPCGFGQVDIMKDTQMYIDLLDASILKNALLKSRPRYFVSDEPNFNAEDLADHTKDYVKTTGSMDERKCKPIETPELPGVCVQVRNNKIDELKETSGNRDFSQGGTAGGITSGSAIAALQEAGNKLSRDQIKSSYRSFVRVVNLIIELVRQFYTEPRSFRITGEGGQPEYIQYSNENITPRTVEGDFGAEAYTKMSLFDIKVTAQKQNSFSREVENERGKELYAAGFFNPQMADQALAALEMMSFEGIEKVRDRISENGTMFQQIQQLQQQLITLSNVVKAMQGGSPVDPAAGMKHPAAQSPPSEGGEDGRHIEAGAFGEAVDKTNAHQAEAMRKKVKAGATPT